MDDNFRNFDLLLIFYDLDLYKKIYKIISAPSKIPKKIAYGGLAGREIGIAWNDYQLLMP